MDLRVDSIVYDLDGSQYIIEAFINRGAFGDVFRIKKKDEVFALKTISTSSLNDNDLQALRNEGKLAVLVNHPNVNKIHYFHDGEAYSQLPPYMIMDYANDGTLQKLIDNQRLTKKQFDIDFLIGVLTDLSKGMEAINDKLIHRDIKPDNILLHNGQVKISDFGLAKIVGAATRSLTFKGIQHIKYMAPEAWLLHKNTIQMDMYSMGIVFYELATLKHPYTIDVGKEPFTAWKEAHQFSPIISPERYNNELTTNVIQVIIKMLNKKQEDRYQSWEEILNRLKENSDNSESIDVSILVQRAQTSYNLETARKLEEERIRAEKEQKSKLIAYKFEEIKNAFKNVVKSFNAKSDIKKISLHDGTSNIECRCNPKKVKANYFEVNEELYLRKQKVLAWGIVETSDELGFNILLIQEKPEDIYGNWITFHNKINPISSIRYNKPEPFAFGGYEDVKSKVQSIQAIDVTVTKEGVFAFDNLLPLFESIL